MAYTIMAMIFVGPVLGYFLGVWLESRWGHAPWLGFVGLVLGGVASVRKVMQLLRQSQSRDGH
jgi:F0F1-type ATP synthase assembly protein I